MTRGITWRDVIVLCLGGAIGQITPDLSDYWFFSVIPNVIRSGASQQVVTFYLVLGYYVVPAIVWFTYAGIAFLLSKGHIGKPVQFKEGLMIASIISGIAVLVTVLRLIYKF